MRKFTFESNSRTQPGFFTVAKSPRDLVSSSGAVSIFLAKLYFEPSDEVSRHAGRYHEQCVLPADMQD